MDRSGEMLPPAPAPEPGKKPKQLRRRWRPDEHTRFLEALHMFGRDWTKIGEHVGTRTTKQLRSHAQKYFDNARKLGVTGLPPPRPMRRRKRAVQQQQTQSSTAGQTPPPPPDMQSFDWASIPGASASAWLSQRGGAESQAEQVAATYPGTGDNSFMGTASFFSAMTMDMNWTGTGTGSTSEAPPSSLPELTTTLAGDEAELEPWDIIMQEIKDMGLDLEFDMSMFPSISDEPEGGSDCGAPHGVPHQPDTSLYTDGGGCSADAKVDG